MNWTDKFSDLLVDYARGTRDRNLPSALLWLLLLVSCILAGSAIALNFPKPSHLDGFVFAISVIAIWRYSWWSVHLVRALIYLFIKFPKMRHRASFEQDGTPVAHVYAIVMSYRIEPDQLFIVYEALLRNAIECNCPVTVIASITTVNDRNVLESVYDHCGSPANVEIITQFQDGSGKRSALAAALKALARRAPEGSSPVLLMDGDIVPEDGSLLRCLQIMQSSPDLAAITTNNDAFVEGSYITRQWYILRYAQRHMLMASMSLSRKLLVLTGRFSIFRAEVATEPEFLELVESDGIRHWRLGEIPFVSGDDKSTWYFAMKHSRNMAYIPDVKVFGFEELPSGTGFFSGTTSLMQRWFGNMLRSSGRAISLGPRKTGFFAFWSLLDQRVSIWTSMIGPVSASLFSLFVSPIYLIYYLLWVLLTRLFMTTVAGFLYGQFSPMWPFLLYFSQVWGAILKAYLWFRPNKQGWTRQKIGTSKSNSITEVWSNRLLHLCSIGVLVLSVGLLLGVFEFPSFYSLEMFVSAFWKD